MTNQRRPKYSEIHHISNRNQIQIILNTPVLDKTDYFFGLAHRGSTIGFHLLWHTVELAMSTRLCLLQCLL